MAEDSRVLELVEEALGSDLTPEQLCAQCPELLPRVREYLKACRKIDSEIEELFPSTSAGRGSGMRRSWGASLPPIPGYEVLEVLGQGGIGIISRVRPIKLNRIVALKMLLSGPYASAVELARFTREAQAVAAL